MTISGRRWTLRCGYLAAEVEEPWWSTTSTWTALSVRALTGGTGRPVPAHGLDTGMDDSDENGRRFRRFGVFPVNDVEGVVLD